MAVPVMPACGEASTAGVFVLALPLYPFDSQARGRRPLPGTVGAAAAGLVTWPWPDCNVRCSGTQRQRASSLRVFRETGRPSLKPLSVMVRPVTEGDRAEHAAGPRPASLLSGRGALQQRGDIQQTRGQWRNVGPAVLSDVPGRSLSGDRQTPAPVPAPVRHRGL